MKILYIAAEATPFVKTGGLADVAGSLPKALNKIGCDCRVVIPLHSAIPKEYVEQMEKIHEFYVQVGWKREYCGVYELMYDHVHYYFLDNKYYFSRPNLYGELDDGERYIFFAKASVQLVRQIDFQVDIIHANDWHSALAPVFLNDYRTGDSFYENVRSLLSIHNLKYQGQYSPELFYWTNLGGQYFNDYDLKFYDSINFLKGGIVHANWVNTVSETYAQEIHYPFFAEGLENVIQANTGKISGILNGIDYSVWNTDNNPLVPISYSVDNMDGKSKNKEVLQKKYGLPVRDDVPMIAMISRLNSMKGLDLVRYILEEFLQEDIQFVVLGTGEATYEEMFRYFTYKYPEKCSARIYFSNDESHGLYAASDFFLMPSISEPCGLSQMIAMRYGSVPVVREAGGLRDSVKPYNIESKEGEGLTFKNINAHDLLFTLQDALNIYTNYKEDYKQMQENAMRKDLSWEQSSQEYLKLYEKIKA